MATPIQLIKKYFAPEEWQNAYQVMKGESGGRPGAVGDQYPIRGTYAPSYGLFQIRGLPGRPAPKQLLDPEFNVRYAAQMQRQQGWSPWTVARKLGLTKAAPATRTTRRPMPTPKPTPRTTKRAGRGYLPGLTMAAPALAKAAPALTGGVSTTGTTKTSYDKDKLRRFRNFAIQAGHDWEDVDKFINDKLEEERKRIEEVKEEAKKLAEEEKEKQEKQRIAREKGKYPQYFEPGEIIEESIEAGIEPPAELPEPELAKEEKEKVAELRELESLAQSIKELAEAGGNVSGPFTGRIYETLSLLGLGDKYTRKWEKGVAQLRSLASQLTAHRSFGEGGKAFTETEKALLAGQVPRLGVREDRPGVAGFIPGLERMGSEGQVLDPESTLVDKMDEILAHVKRKRDQLGISGPTSDWEIVE